MLFTHGSFHTDSCNIATTYGCFYVFQANTSLTRRCQVVTIAEAAFASLRVDCLHSLQSHLHKCVCWSQMKGAKVLTLFCLYFAPVWHKIITKYAEICCKCSKNVREIYIIPYCTKPTHWIWRLVYLYIYVEINTLLASNEHPHTLFSKSSNFTKNPLVPATQN